MRRIVLSLVLLVASAACGSSGADEAGGGEGVQLSLVAYSTPQEAYGKIIKAFQKTPQGKGVTFTESYGASGDQSRAVESGLAADVVAFSLEPDMTRLVKKGIVADDWNSGQYKGMVTDSVTVFVVRKGNPDNIRTWADLTKPGVEVITPNPLTSGGARWNIMAAYGAQLKLGKTEEEAVAYLGQLFAHVPVLDKSARESLATFSGGKGDVLLGYENEVITAQQKGEELEYIVPDQTILIENPVAVVTESVNPEQAAQFVAFLRTPEAQRVFGDKGYRPIVPDILAEFDYPTPSDLFTIADHGGWADVTTKFFDPNNGVVAQILQQ